MAVDTRVVDKIGLARRGVGVAGQGPRVPRKKSGSTPLGRAGKTLALFALPSLILLVLLNVYPVAYSFLQSLQQGTPSTLPWETPFVGLQNYTDVLTSDAFRNSTVFTIVFTVTGVFGSWLVGLGLALLLRTRIPANGLFKVLLLLPWIVPVVVSATSWNWLVATPQSPIPIILETLGIPDANFLGDPLLAQVVVCVFKVWISFPFMLMMMSSALASVDTIISRTTYISWVLMTIFCVNDFPTIFLLTQGGPVNATTSLIVLAYQQAFQNLQTGPATAVAFMMTAVLVIVSTLLYRQIKKADIE
jgi:multiple sugar transport system permease protein